MVRRGLAAPFDFLFDIVVVVVVLGWELFSCMGYHREGGTVHPVSIGAVQSLGVLFSTEVLSFP